MNFDAKKHYVKIYSHHDNAFLFNLLKKSNRHYISAIKINVTNMRIVININKHYLNVKNFEDYKKDYHK